MGRSNVVMVLVVCCVMGCGDAKRGADASQSVAFKKEAMAGAAPPPGMPMRQAPMAPGAVPEQGDGKLAGGGKPVENKPEAEPPMERKIIYSANIEVVVKNVDEARQEVDRIVEELKGYISKSEVTGDSGKRRVGSWTLKIPSEKFRLATASLAKLGNTTKNSSDSQDVTEEFIDVQARLKNLKAEEEVLNKLLKDAVRLEDVLKLRDQIKNIRSDIERTEGRLKYLSTMAALSTITLTAREEDEKYVPPTAPTPPTFLQSVQTTFDDSWKSLQNVGIAVALFFVSLAPWLPLILVGVLLIRFWFRWMSRSLKNFIGDEEEKPKKAKLVESKSGE